MVWRERRMVRKKDKHSLLKMMKREKERGRERREKEKLIIRKGIWRLPRV
jgi:hypothetical protein